MDVIIRERRTGRTTELIQRCAEHRYALIVTPDRNRARTVFNMAQEMGKSIPYPITFEEFVKARFDGKYMDAFLFDDIDASLNRLSRGVPIEAVVIEEKTAKEKPSEGDLISRKKALDLAKDICVPTKDGSIYRHRCIDPDAIRELPTVQAAQTEHIMNEWCTDCKEYDHEKHCCPRFNRVIEKTVKEVKENNGIVTCSECVHNPKKSWFGCPMSHLREEQRPETAWCWKGERRTDG